MAFPRKSRKRLANLTIDEVSGVDFPAHLANGWAVLKSAGGDPAALSTLETAEEMSTAIEGAASVLSKASVLANLDDADKAATVKLFDAVLAAIDTASESDGGDADADGELTKSIEAMRELLAADVTKTSKPTTGGSVTGTDTGTQAGTGADAADADEMLKALPEPLRKRFEENERIAKEAQDVAKAAQEVAKAERDQRIHTEYVAKAKALTYVSGDPEVLAKAMRLAEEGGPELKAEFERVLRQAEEFGKQADIYGELGSAAGDVVGGAYEQISAAAAELRKAKPELTEAQAISKAAEQNPKLAAEYGREMAERVGR